MTAYVQKLRPARQRCSEFSLTGNWSWASSQTFLLCTFLQYVV